MDPLIQYEIEDFILERAAAGYPDTPPALIFEAFAKRYPGVDILEEALIAYGTLADRLHEGPIELRASLNTRRAGRN